MNLDILNWWATSGLPTIEQFFGRLPFEWAQQTFMVRALIECLLLAPICAVMGVKVVNFRMAFFSDAISHSAFAGVAIGLLLNEFFSLPGDDPFYPRLSLIGFGLLVGLGIALVRRRTSLSNDTVIGVFFSAVVALGIAIVTSSGSRTADFQRYLYGDILTLDAADLGLTALLAGVVLVFAGLGFNSMLMLGLNAELAHSRGIRVRLYDYLFAVVLALVVTVSIRTAGILLVTALLVVPAAAARNVAANAGGMLRWAIVFGLASAISGTLASYSPYLHNMSTGAAIVLTAALLFALSFVARRA
ncbi:MAG TPA: metal ABC transporter permease [Phycisphaerae bacterium]|jgi:zinc transport system permease protein|nr:metal ABC transporter permease [Phycisphaerae bacterium]HOB75656.1 metal ABC transporter permease [Phycisphaerae bacterium]HPU32593.1 metal ABC transporter permease [Phycisphaerae bacterium]HQA45262.1 metal ABC transporter permease [Phycisphaerae bacterium]HXK85542.1 metal ABC transporter permease [Phycisphaerae bacterium]